ncbi:hypothetical protein [Parageobacillus thermoglucosidasius]|uniref:Uncharacterized protein n=1 Tax=Parageobacillus thermoglucosidasius TaxID=1426 RepID=A0A1B7KMI8_PARTM|nr:hypothetical protein [Parageobacillus thermoglucosidasius]OAT71304.1 hypothetical protein A7K69_14540 [Parageobacillus thermoglucosidasius]
MYSVQQLQALDYLLKRITSEPSYPVFKKNLKLVIEVHNQYWYGDFVQLDGTRAFQLFIDNSGDVEKVSLSPADSNAVNILTKIWKAYSFTAKTNWSNPFEKINNLPLLFEALTKILDRTDITNEDSPFSPYLFNAKLINSNVTLPFINLGEEKIKLISLIEVDDA